MLRTGNPSRRQVSARAGTWRAALAVGMVVVGMVAAGPTPSAASATTAPIPGIDWRPCAQDAAAQCGTLSVPVDWDDPNGPRFTLALARRSAKEPAARVGTLVFGPGGPGDSGVSRVVSGISRFSPDIQRRFDIVGFDPRGVGASSPVRCSTALLNQRPAPVLRSQADFNATVAYNQRLREDCRSKTGPVFDHLDTLSTARDLDAIRAALGEVKLTFHGSSYGTLLGEQYAELFPHRVRAMVLESVMDHSLGTRAFLNTQTAAAQDSFDAFVAWCDRTERCALHGQDVHALWADLLDRSSRAEVPDPRNPAAALTPYALSGLLAPRALYEPDYPGLAETIRTLSTAPSAALGAHERAAAATGPETQTSANPLAIFCQDWRLPIRNYPEYAARIDELARIGTDLPYPQALAVVEACLGTPTVDNPQHRLRLRTDEPLLLLNALHDPATGHNWATNVARQLGRHGVLLTYEGAGHGIYNATECTRGTVDRYLIDLVTPAPGTSCPATEPVPAAAG